MIPRFNNSMESNSKVNMSIAKINDVLSIHVLQHLLPLVKVPACMISKMCLHALAGCIPCTQEDYSAGPACQTFPLPVTHRKLIQFQSEHVYSKINDVLSMCCSTSYL